MKLIKYQLMTEVNHGTEEEPNIVQTFSNKEILCNDSNFESNLAIAEAEAYGEVTVEEVADKETTPSQLDVIEAQVTYTAMMTDTLLEGV